MPSSIVPLKVFMHESANRRHENFREQDWYSLIPFLSPASSHWLYSIPCFPQNTLSSLNYPHHLSGDSYFHLVMASLAAPFHWHVFGIRVGEYVKHHVVGVYKGLVGLGVKAKAEKQKKRWRSLLFTNECDRTLNHQRLQQVVQQGHASLHSSYSVSFS